MGFPCHDSLLALRAFVFVVWLCQERWKTLTVKPMNPTGRVSKSIRMRWVTLAVVILGDLGEVVLIVTLGNAAIIQYICRKYCGVSCL